MKTAGEGDGVIEFDLRKELKALYGASVKEVRVVEVPSMNFLMLDGSGDPGASSEFGEAISALYAVSYGVKSLVKKVQGLNYTVMPLEGLWWVDDMEQFRPEDRHLWKWTLMIMQPQQVDQHTFSQGLEQAPKKSPARALGRMRFEAFHEGVAAQILHIGPYSQEGPTIERMHSFIRGMGYELTGKHHEIYLGDPRRSAPEKLKTILRQPIFKP